MLRNKNLKLKLLFIVFLCFISHALHARAGGGGGGAAVHGAGIIIGLINLVLILFFVHRKNKRSQKLIQELHDLDPLWDYDAMITLANNMFLKMQNAWMERDMELVKEEVTQTLYADYKKKLDWMSKKREKNIIKDIEIKKVKIIGEERHVDKNEDCFTVYITGHLIDYDVYERTGTKIGDDQKSNPFSDLYYFVRNGNNWLLDKIDNKVSLDKILKARQIIEQ